MQVYNLTYKCVLTEYNVTFSVPHHLLKNTHLSLLPSSLSCPVYLNQPLLQTQRTPSSSTLSSHFCCCFLLFRTCTFPTTQSLHTNFSSLLQSELHASLKPKKSNYSKAAIVPSCVFFCLSSPPLNPVQMFSFQLSLSPPPLSLRFISFLPIPPSYFPNCPKLRFSHFHLYNLLLLHCPHICSIFTLFPKK